MVLFRLAAATLVLLLTGSTAVVASHAASTLAPAPSTQVHFKGPTGIAIDRAGHLYVADVESDKVYRVSARGRVLGTIGRYPLATNPMMYPFGVAVGPGGNVYVAVSTSGIQNPNGPFHGRVQQFSSADRMTAEYGSESLSSAVFIAVDARGDVWVADIQARLITEFAPTGQRLRHWMTSVRPFGIALGSWGRVYVSLPMIGIVAEYGPSGSVIRSFGDSQTMFGFEPGGLAVDQGGNLYVADAHSGHLIKVSPTGKLLARWGRPGSQRGQIDFCSPARPSGVTLDASGNVYVAGKCSATIEKFSPQGTLLAVYG